MSTISIIGSGGMAAALGAKVRRGDIFDLDGLKAAAESDGRHPRRA